MKSTGSISPAKLSFFYAIIASVSLLAVAQNLKINYYSDDQCRDYIATLEHHWATRMDTYPGGCFDYQRGSSMLISECNSGTWCMCKLFKGKNCQGEYSSMQYSGWEPEDWEYNCKMNGQDFQSMECFYF